MLKCVLWDFGDTLVDERWMLAPLPGVPAWPAVWSRVAGGELAEAWNLGRISIPTVVDALAAELGIAAELVREHMRRCCERIEFFDAPLQIAKRSSLPQAIVTVNPDGFSELVVRPHRLERIFDLIVTSWEHGTLDKGFLGLEALRRLGGAIHPSEALLIDNRAHHLDEWAARGGRGYLFRGPEPFAADLQSELRELAASAESTC